MELATLVAFCLFPFHTEAYEQGEDKRFLEEPAPGCGRWSRNHIRVTSEMRFKAVTAPTPDFPYGRDSWVEICLESGASELTNFSYFSGILIWNDL